MKISNILLVIVVVLVCLKLFDAGMVFDKGFVGMKSGVLSSDPSDTEEDVYLSKTAFDKSEYLTPQAIPSRVVEVAHKYNVASEIFSSELPIIYYDSIGCPNYKAFDSKVSSYLKNNNYYNNGIYKILIQTTDEHNDFYSRISNSVLGLADVTQGEPCGTEEECKAMVAELNKGADVQNADLKVLLDFLNACTDSFCIINPRRGEYLKLSAQSADTADKAFGLIEKYKNWN